MRRTPRARAREPVAQAPVGAGLQQSVLRIQQTVGERHIVTDAGGVEARGPDIGASIEGPDAAAGREALSARVSACEMERP